MITIKPEHLEATVIAGGIPITGGEDAIKPEPLSDRVIRKFSRRLADYEKRCG